MDIRNLMNRLDNIEQSSGIKKYISEGLYSTPEMQKHWKRIDENFFKGYDSYLTEAALTADQIQSIFKQAEAGGGAGAAPKDPGKLAAIVDKVMPSSQAAALGSSLPEPDAGPVQGFEQKAAAAVDALPGADNSTKQSLMQWIKQGVSKPETQQLILAAVGAGVGGLLTKVGPIISMIPGGGPVAAAITGAIIAGAVSVASAKLQGKDWKSAFKGAIKPALMGGAAAVVGNLATSAVGAMMGGGDKAADSASGGQGSPEQQKGLAADQAYQDSMLKKYPPDQGYTFGASGDSLQVFDANGRKVFTGDIPLKTMDMKTFADLTNNGQMATPGTSSGAVSSDPMAGVSDSSGKRGDSGWNSMKANTNPDGSPMTLDQINQAKADLRAGNAINNPAANGQTELTPAQSDKMTAMQMQAGSLGAGQGGDGQSSGIRPRLPPGASLSDFSNTSGGSDDFKPRPSMFDTPGATDNPTGAGPRQSNLKIPVDNLPGGAAQQSDWANGNNPPPEWVKNNQTGKYEPPGGPADWANGNNPPPEWVKNNQTSKYEPPGGPADWANGNNPPPEWVKNSSTGKYEPPGGPADWANGNNPPPEWIKNNQTGKYQPPGSGLKESFAESIYVDKQATLRMWLDQEAKGLAVSGLALKPTVKEGILDSIKGMFGGKKGANAPAAGGGVTADALNKAWTAAGSPTDSEEVAKVLQGAGVAPEAVNKIFADLKLPAPGAASAETPAGTEDPVAADPATAPGAEDPAGAETPAAGMKADEIVQALSTFWDQVTASQDSRSSAPAVQQQIKAMAKDAAMTGQVFESKYWNNK